MYNNYSTTYRSKRGYVFFKATKKPVHRWIMEKIIGDELRPGTVVHHRDGNKANNRPSNLKLFPSQKAHFMYHLNNKKKTGNWYGANRHSSSFDF
ncbi:MAG: HNH endonuclease [Candidatus Falkowbacteria bacterium]|nr:MAG: HNH endonuclease [Candidatus Falkowbacteria bacterium]